MSDDIVSVLREMKDSPHEEYAVAFEHAADEIDRLRAELADERTANRIDTALLEDAQAAIARVRKLHKSRRYFKGTGHDYCLPAHLVLRALDGAE